MIVVDIQCLKMTTDHLRLFGTMQDDCGRFLDMLVVFQMIQDDEK